MVSQKKYSQLKKGIITPNLYPSIRKSHNNLIDNKIRINSFPKRLSKRRKVRVKVKVTEIHLPTDGFYAGKTK